MKKKNKKTKKILYVVSIVVSVISFIVLMSFSHTLLNLNMIPNKYLIIFFMVISVFYSLLYLLTLIPNIKNIFKLIACVFLILFSSTFLFGSHYVDSTINFVDKINDNLLQNEEYYLITSENSTLLDVSSANGKKVGFYKNNSVNTESAVNSLKEKITFIEKDYDDVVTMFEDLENNEIDALLINTSVKNLLTEDLSYLNLNTKDIGTVLVPIKTTDIVKVVDVTNTPFNIYIAGGDSYGSITRVSNGDVNIIVTINPKTRQIHLTSIPRDYYVNLADKGENAYDKLTHAGYYGIETQVKTIERILEIDINYYVKVNFSTVVELVDVIGGVYVNSEVAFCTYYDPDKCFKQGNIYLNGEDALIYARERKVFLEGDRMRQKHQQQIIDAIINKFTSSTVLISKYANILSSLQDNFQTNIDSNTINRLVKFQLNDMRGWNISSYSLNGTDFSSTNTYSYPGQLLYVMKPNEETVIEAQNKIKEMIIK